MALRIFVPRGTRSVTVTQGSRSTTYRSRNRGGSSLFSLGRSIYRRVTAKSKMQWGGQDGGLDADLWEEYSTEVIEAQIDKAGNAGQETLLGPDYFGKHAIDFCETVTDDYDDRAFVSYVENELGSDYYNAISEIIDECSEELYEAWDQAYSNDGVGDKLFGDFYNSNSVYGTFGNAVSAYNTRAAGKYKNYNWNGSAAHLAAKRATIVNFRAANPNGTSRTTRATPFAGRTYAQRQAVGKAAATKFLKQNPTGIRRTGL
jgi:hypothetical protein